MQSMKKSKNSGKKKNLIPSGEYTSVVVSVEWNDEYDVEEVLDVVYEVTDATGKTYQLKERFYNDDYNDRTAEFDEYLKSNGIRRYDDFIGCTEEILVKKKLVHHSPMSSIVERKMISTETAQVISNAVED